MRRTCSILLGLLAGLLLVAGVANAADWATWRGPNGNGLTAENGWDARALSAAKIVWRSNVGKGHSSVAVADGRLFTMGQRQHGEGDGARHEDVVYCLDARSGKELWSYAYPIEQRDFPGPGATPVVDSDRVYTISRLGDVYCFEAASGKVLWRKNLVNEELAAEPNWGFCGSVMIEGELALINAGRSGLALDKTTGKVIWSSEPTAGYLATPVIFDHHGKRLAIISANATAYAVDVATGTVQWSHEWQSDADPTVLGDQVLLMGAGRGNGSQLLKMNGTSQPEVVWEGDGLSGAFQTAVVIDGHAYGFGRDRRAQPLQCVDLRTGEVAWSENLGDWGGIIAANNQLIVVTGSGELIIAPASPNGFTPTARARVLEMRDWQSYPRREPKTCWTNPVLANGRVYVRDTWGDVACVDLTS